MSQWKTPMLDYHIAKDARLTDVHGLQQVADYGDEIMEHHGARKSAGLFDLSHLGKLKIYGDDRQNFLQGIVSQNVKSIRVGEGAQSCLLSRTGRIQGLFDIYADKDHYYVEGHPAFIEKFQNTLNEFLFTEKVRVENVSPALSIFSLLGPNADAVLNAATNLEITDLRPRHFLRADWKGKELTVAIHNWFFGLWGYQLYIAAEHGIALWENLLKAGKDFDLTAGGLTAYQSLQFECGIPQMYVDLDEDVSPPEAGLEGTCPPNQGCYLGQEPIEMMRSRGRVPKKMIGLLLEGNLLPNKNNRVFVGGENVGRVTSALFSPTLKKGIALAFVKTEMAREDSPFIIEHDGNRISGQSTGLPFVK